MKTANLRQERQARRIGLLPHVKTNNAVLAVNAAWGINKCSMAVRGEVCVHWWIWLWRQGMYCRHQFWLMESISCYIWAQLSMDNIFR